MASSLTALCVLFLFALSAHAQQEGDVRLVGGPSPNKGRVEVYHDGLWGTICDDSWNLVDGDVICRQLGFEGAELVRYRAFFGQGTGPIWIDQTHCLQEHQSILKCGHNGWGLHDCRHREDAGVECKRKVPDKPKELPLRLSCPESSTCGSCKACADKSFPDPTDCLPQRAVKGIVEAYHDGKWHAVSNDGWNAASARVACGQLGFPIAVGVPTIKELWCNWNKSTDNAEFRDRLLKSALIKGLECLGNENELVKCYFQAFGPIRVASLADVATVSCGYTPHPQCAINGRNTEAYRTRGTAVPWQGRVEVRIRGEWGTVSDILWDVHDANVACRALGYGTAKTATYFSNFGRGVGTVHFSNLKCAGNEFLLSRCSSVTGPAAQTYGHQRDAGLVCNIPNRESCEIPSSRIVKQPETNGYMSNFVEVHDDQRGWGFLCSESMDMKVASVVCRETMQLFAFRMRKADHPDFTRPRYSSQLNCTGEESSLRECRRELIPVRKCREKEVILDCRPDLPDLVPDVGPFERSLQFYPYVDRSPLYYLRCAHEEKCLSSSADGQSFDSNRVLLRFSSQTMNFGTADFEPILDRSKWIWHSCHNHFHSFEAFIHYDLIDPETGAKVAEGHKASFCLEDSYCERGGRPRYRCASGIQGISMNCGDLYARYLDCQWIDITDIAHGTYILRQTVNPDGLALETDYRNNVEECTVTYYPGGSLYLNPGSCRLSDH